MKAIINNHIPHMLLMPDQNKQFYHQKANIIDQTTRTPHYWVDEWKLLQSFHLLIIHAVSESQRTPMHCPNTSNQNTDTLISIL